MCCSYIQKQVILAKDHDADTEAVIFHNDIRSFGKDFERFYNRAADLSGVRFVRSYVSIGQELPDTKNVTIRYATDDEALDAFHELTLKEGIIPALESSHAMAEAKKRAPGMPADSVIVVNLSGRGDKDVDAVLEMTNSRTAELRSNEQVKP